MGKRLPTILGKAIDDVVKTLNEQVRKSLMLLFIPSTSDYHGLICLFNVSSQSEEELIIDLNECIRRMDKLMEDLTGNQKLRPIIDDNEADVALWNKEIAKFFQGKDFMNAPWLFAEAYKYRRLRECFSVSKYWKVCSSLTLILLWKRSLI